MTRRFHPRAVTRDRFDGDYVQSQFGHGNDTTVAGLPTAVGAPRAQRARCV